MNDVWCMTYGLPPMVYAYMYLYMDGFMLICMMYDTYAWCIMYDAWCMMHDEALRHFRHSSLGPQAATPKNFEAHSKNLDAYSKNLEAQSKNFEAQPKNLEAQPKNLEAQSGPGRRNQPPRT